MVNKEKVIAMTKLASYEKHRGRSDKRLMEYFQLDYIALNNFKTHIAVTFALLIIFGIHATDIVLKNMSAITEIDYMTIGKKYLIIWIAVIVIYTIISSISSWYEYRKSKTRIKEYNELLEKLGRL